MSLPELKYDLLREAFSDLCMEEASLTLTPFKKYGKGNKEGSSVTSYLEWSTQHLLQGPGSSYSSLLCQGSLLTLTRTTDWEFMGWSSSKDNTAISLKAPVCRVGVEHGADLTLLSVNIISGR